MKSTLNGNNIGSPLSKSEILSTQVEIEKLTRQLENLQKQEENQGKKSTTNWTNSISKILRYGAALMSIRSIYSLLSNCANEWLNSNDTTARQLKANIDYMKYAVGSAFKNVLQGIVNILYQILSLVNSIAKSFLGIDLFSSASVEDYKKMQKSSEQIKKNLQQANFDEQNVLQDSNSSSSNGDNLITPNFDFGKSNDDMDKFAQNAKEKFNEISNFWEENWKQYMDSATGNWGSFIQGLLLTLEGFYQIFKGVWDSCSGLIDIFIGLFTGNIQKIEDGWNKLCQGIKELAIGLCEILVGIVLTLFGAIKGILLDLWNAIVSLFGGIGNWFNEQVILPIKNFISSFVENWKNGCSIIKDWTSEKFNGIKQIISSAVSFIISLPSKIKDAFVSTFNNILNVARNVWNQVLNLFSKGGKIFSGITNGIANTFKTIVNALITGINKVIAIPFNKINSVLNSIRNKSFLGISPFKGLWSQNPLPVPKIPMLAKGGIVAQPTQAIIGEAGKEAVLPLENNTEWMYELARIIAQNSSQVIELVVDGKVLAKIVNDYNQRKQFATNG